ncbi:putative lipoate--protein ligase, partial [Ascoidea rubescens DSM 1968]
LSDLVKQSGPHVFISKLHNPYLNLALEDYIFNNMPIKDYHNKDNNKNNTGDGKNLQSFKNQRLVFYINQPCIVFGKNQNGWKEMNYPLVKRMGFPTLRRKSGGGCVVHDKGNVNFSFITSKNKFDRKFFSNVIIKEVNGFFGEKRIDLNERGDIIEFDTQKKISGSAYKVSRGRCYHHGTMLLNSELPIIRQLLKRDERKLGKIENGSSIESVRSSIGNLKMDKEVFMDIVIQGFKKKIGNGNKDFKINISYIEEKHLNSEIKKSSEELKNWEWNFGSTPKFKHYLYNEEFKFKLILEVEKGHLKGIDIKFDNDENIQQNERVIESMNQIGINLDHKIRYTGSEISGFILNDKISDWVGSCIDGSL